MFKSRPEHYYLTEVNSINSLDLFPMYCQLGLFRVL